ncbi:MAG: LamG domain-containing protein [Planctomycetaceae bacterium]|nr:LamG domain-containing protein [Planctomycetaceae bacterium]
MATSVNTTEYMFLTTDAGGPDGMEFSISSTGIPGQQSVISADQFPLNMETHYAVTIDAATDIAGIYINGSLVATSSGVTLTPSSLGNTTSNYLGRSQFADPFLIGSINEFRIYDNALTAAEVNAVSWPAHSNVFLSLAWRL